jgi:MATE family, multidrug efflux pump
MATQLAIKAPWRAEFRATFKLAWPLILAQLAQISLYTTDVIVMGWLGVRELAAGTLATALLHPLLVGGFGVVTATAAVIAQAVGARDPRSVRRTVRQGFWMAAILTAIIIPILLNSTPILTAMGQDPETVALTSTYLKFAAWSVPGNLLFIVLRSLMSARGNTGTVLVITLVAVLANIFANYALVFGNFGFPRLELAGAAIATTIVSVIMFLAALGFVVFHRRYKRFYVLMRLFRPDWGRLIALFRIGLPIGLTLLSEVGLFGVAIIMMGWLGTAEVAAHAVAVQTAAIAFMVPLGLSQATTVRVGLAIGTKNPGGVGVAGWTSFAMALSFMMLTSAIMVLYPHLLAAAFLDLSVPANAVTLSLAVTYLGVAALFQLVDGAQVTMGAALRGLNDTRVPMLLSLVGYWAVGLTVSYVLGFVLGWRGLGIWLGLAAGLAFVAVVLTVRFARREKLGLYEKASPI